MQDIQGKFAHEIVATSNSCLRQHIVGTASPNVVLPRQPCVVQHASRERAAVHRHLWPKVVLTSVIGYKVSRYSVARARPEPLATAKVVPWLIPEQSIPRRQYAALNY